MEFKKWLNKIDTGLYPLLRRNGSEETGERDVVTCLINY